MTGPAPADGRVHEGGAAPAGKEAAAVEKRPAAESAIAGLHPAYFALVMATGIVSIAADACGYGLAAQALFFLNIAFFAALWLLTAIRVGRHRPRVRADLLDHNRGVGFFTMVAGTNVLGSQFLVIAQVQAAALGLWCLGLLLWIVLTYTIFTILTVKAVKPPLSSGINGGWLVAVVATQSVSALSSQLAAGLSAGAESMLLFALVMWLGGGMLYIWIIALIFYRYTFFRLEPSDLTPPYWINMGAMAISTLAGALLAASAAGSPLLRQILPFIKGFTLFFWSTATWWIPMLVILGFWRHVFRRFPLTYDPLYWGAVFPLGMYTTCTYKLAGVFDVGAFRSIASSFVLVALGAWLLTAIGLARRLFSLALGPRARSAQDAR